jgi:hypothetical protein
MTQFDGRPVEMMEYVEEYVMNARMIAIDPPPASPPATPTLQIAGPAIIENGPDDMDTREKSGKRPRVLTGAKSKTN